eukprot:2407160-Pyramimonas_sp.AAC.1
MASRGRARDGLLEEFLAPARISSSPSPASSILHPVSSDPRAQAERGQGARRRGGAGGKAGG